MTDEPKPKTTESRPKSGGPPSVGTRPPSASPGLTQGDPKRRVFSDKRDDSSRDGKNAKEEVARPGGSPPNVQGKSGGDANTQAKTPEVKPTRTLSDGRPV